MSENLIVIFCPPISQYPEQPKDQSISEKVNCPTCKEQMWLSEKKKKLIELAKTNENDIHLECYDCFLKTVRADPNKWKDHVRIDL